MPQNETSCLLQSQLSLRRPASANSSASPMILGCSLKTPSMQDSASSLLPRPSRHLSHVERGQEVNNPHQCHWDQIKSNQINKGSWLALRFLLSSQCAPIPARLPRPSESAREPRCRTTRAVQCRPETLSSERCWTGKPSRSSTFPSGSATLIRIWDHDGQRGSSKS